MFETLTAKSWNLQARHALGPDGVLYHVESSPDFETIAEAKAWADAQAWGRVAWDEVP